MILWQLFHNVYYVLCDFFVFVLYYILFLVFHDLSLLLLLLLEHVPVQHLLHQPQIHDEATPPSTTLAISRSDSLNW